MPEEKPMLAFGEQARGIGCYWGHAEMSGESVEGCFCRRCTACLRWGRQAREKECYSFVYTVKPSESKAMMPPTADTPPQPQRLHAVPERSVPSDPPMK